ncbi:hypothetical protein [Streptomyces sp. V2I9]|uniref:hypothetical protein n=1 Tax=Streptomyces sp. V2I9 TaxID=3042304 RepID=UPI0027859033|nr:hypothetical protein [Streptomyces sp. V2I9]MDQ0984327.1 hypothetical protein [Streptomyces sp. V2I9]
MDTNRREVLAEVASAERPSSPEVIAEAVDARRVRARARLTDFDPPEECVEVEAVAGLLRDLQEAGQVKGYPRDVWVSLGTEPGATAHPTALLWWPLTEWRAAAVRRARRDLVVVRREGARRAEERAKRVSRVSDAVDRVLVRRRRDAQHPYDGLDPL